MNRRDQRSNFYEFLASEVIPHQDQILKDTDASFPAEFLNKGPTTGAEFPCKLFHNHTNPKSVHRLKPSDIDYVAALGDSITAAFGAKSRNLLEIFAEFRGVSWSIGGDNSLKDVVTVPNIIKEYYSDVKGFSVGITPLKIRIPWKSHLNYAVSGAISIDLPGQAEKLIKQLKSFDDYKDSWKLLTIWIGGNDLCGYCKNDKHTLDKYVGGIRDALDMFHKEVPKMFVNLVQIIDVTELAKINSDYCRPLHYILCKCGTSAGEAMKQTVKEMATKYRAGVDDLINSGRYDTRKDFTVVIQPFFTNTHAPRMPDNKTIDMTYFAPDCFHFSAKGHKAAALALWNNMIEPVGKKRLMWSEGEQFECPNKKFPYFFTKKNSKEFIENKFDESEELLHLKATKLDSVAHSSIDGKKDGCKNGCESGSSTTTIGLVVAAAVMVAVVAIALVVKSRQRGYEKLTASASPTQYHSI